ncbi:NUDIX domain-containing protein [Saccharibacter sp. 17.LH.SD]|nr:NUDIX domain-containing protein [Saccharibacter sp. 17.LH.SD]
MERCRNVTLPHGRLPLYRTDILVGWIDPNVVPHLKSNGYAPFISITDTRATLTQPDSIKRLSILLADQNIYRPFREWFDVTSPDNVILDQIDRGLIPLLGVEAAGVHLNGLVKKDDTLFLWVAQRSQTKRLDPGKLDHLVAGGMSSGLSPKETIIKEAQEEASIPETLVQKATHVSTLCYAMLRPEGLRRDRLYCYDLFLPEDFIPIPSDGEVEAFHLKPLAEVFRRIQKTDDFKFNVNLVIIDLFLRHGFFPKEDEGVIHAALYPKYSTR